jgi:hypothetical protein
MRIKMGLLILCAFVLAALAAFGLSARPAQAQNANTTMRVLLERLNSGDGKFTVQFHTPLAPGETTWGLPGGDPTQRHISEIGDDYVCFTEQWNNSTRDRCTPFSNIVSISYIH